jgi:hypothetical protein
VPLPRTCRSATAIIIRWQHISLHTPAANPFRRRRGGESHFIFRLPLSSPLLPLHLDSLDMAFGAVGWRVAAECAGCISLETAAIAHEDCGLGKGRGGWS